MKGSDSDRRVLFALSLVYLALFVTYAAWFRAAGFWYITVAVTFGFILGLPAAGFVWWRASRSPSPSAAATPDGKKTPVDLLSFSNAPITLAVPLHVFFSAMGAKTSASLGTVAGFGLGITLPLAVGLLLAKPAATRDASTEAPERPGPRI